MKMNNKAASLLSTNSDRSSKVNFSIGDPAKIIHILRNSLYSKPVQTCVQEYISNARDAMREAGKKDEQIVVTLPTRAEARIKIRDFGLGLSEERVRNIFTQYGKSTKDSSNDETGGFGLGAKSAWAYTNSFIVISYLDGEASSYVAHIGDNFEGTLELYAKNKTNEKNGTEIQIALKKIEDIEEFRTAVYRATLFWLVRPLLKGILEKEIPSFYKNLSPIYHGEGWRLFENSEALGGLFPHKDSQNTGLVAAIDSIPYVIETSLSVSTPAVRSLSDALRSDKILVLDVSNGLIDVNASRETIADSGESKKEVAALSEKVFNSIKTQIKSALLAEKDVRGFVPKFRSFLNYFNMEAVVNKIIFKANGFSFTPSQSYKSWSLAISGDNIRSVLVNCYGFKTSYRSHTKGRMSQSEVSSLPLHYFEKWIFQDDANVKLSSKKLKARQILEAQASGRDRSIYLIEIACEDETKKEDTLSALKKALSIASLSETQILVKTASGTKKMTEHESRKGMVCIKEVATITSPYGSGTLTTSSVHDTAANFKDSKKSFAYFVDTNEMVSELGGSHTIAAWATFLKMCRGITVCSLSQRSISQLSSCENFKPLGDYIKSFKAQKLLTDDEKLFIERRSLNSLEEELSYIYHGKTKGTTFTDKRMNEIIASFEKIHNYDKKENTKKLRPIESALFEAVYIVLPEWKEETERVKYLNSLITELKNEFHLLDYLRGAFSEWELKRDYNLAKCQEMVKEVAVYMNSKKKFAVVAEKAS